MPWECPAIDHGITIFPDQKIRPCCQTSAEYSQPLSSINDPLRFADLKKQDRPDACKVCWQNENHGYQSYRSMFFKMYDPDIQGIQFLDFRHSNQCNLKCRYCNPHFSNQWAKELKYLHPLRKSEIFDYEKTLFTDSVRDIYWCGGEPLIIGDHYETLQKFIDLEFSRSINLRYNTNLSVIDYKDVDLALLWKNFKHIDLSVSLDAAGPEVDHIRSGSKWTVIADNIDRILEMQKELKNISVSIACTVSLLNIWFLPDLFKYGADKKIKINLNVLTGPDYLSLDAVPVSLQKLAKEKIDSIKDKISESDYRRMSDMLCRTDTEYLFLHAVRHILLLDEVRDESLFKILPFKDLALELTVKNNEYE